MEILEHIIGSYHSKQTKYAIHLCLNVGILQLNVQFCSKNIFFFMKVGDNADNVVILRTSLTKARDNQSC